MLLKTSQIIEKFCLKFEKLFLISAIESEFFFHARVDSEGSSIKWFDAQILETILKVIYWLAPVALWKLNQKNLKFEEKSHTFASVIYK